MAGAPQTAQRTTRLGALFATLVLAACAQGPAEFTPRNPLITAGVNADAGREASVHVAPVAGITDEAGDRLRRLVAANLRDLGLPAVSGSPSTRTYVVTGTARTEALSARESALMIEWRVLDPHGRELFTLVQTREVDTDAWTAGSVALLARVAERAAPGLESLLRDVGVAQPSPEPASAVAVAPVYVAPVHGAPGDGGPALAEAMRAALDAAQVIVADDFGDDTYLILGSVHVAEDGGGPLRLEVDWTLIEPSGAEVGVVSQSSLVERDRLGAPWDSLARTIVARGAPEIAELLRTAGPVPPVSAGD